MNLSAQLLFHVHVHVHVCVPISADDGELPEAVCRQPAVHGPLLLLRKQRHEADRRSGDAAAGDLFDPM